MKMSRFTIVTAATLLACAGCATPPAAPTTPTLYQRLGGQPAIDAVVEDGIVNIATDPRINRRFAGTSPPALKRVLVEFICARTGGPCVYTGRNMADVHDGMNIRDDEFDALVQDLVKSLDKHRVPAREQAELLELLGAMRNAIVGH
jgi:hemoglobin